MKASEFYRAVDDEFGEAQGRVLIRDLVIDELGGRTAAVAIADGVPPGSVWVALCRANQVPADRWHGRGRPASQR